MSIGEKESASETAHVTIEERKSLPPGLMKSTQLNIRNGKLTNRNASNQKQDEDSRSRATAKVLTILATLEDLGTHAILRSFL